MRVITEVLRTKDPHGALHYLRKDTTIRKRKVRSYWDPVYPLREITSLFPREMPGRLHVRGSPNNQTLHSKVIFTQLIRKIFYTFDTH